MKAWFGQGACHLSLWGQISEDEKQAGTKWIADAFKTPLGAYFRVDHLSISDLQAALNETGCVYATAQIHDGWTDPHDGFIVFGPKSEPRGGHAFLLIGYDDRGFWIQNSWGSGWALEGFAHLSYADWSTNAMDSWIGQLGIYRSVHAPSLATGLDLKFLSGQQEKAASVENSLLSGNPSISVQQINPYIIDIGNNGELSDDGKFATRIDDLRNLLQIYLPQAISQFELSSDKPIDVAIYAHGGLTDEEGALDTARSWVPLLFARRIFPIFILWETGLWETLFDILKDVNTKRAAVAGGLLDGVIDWWDERLEGLASVPGTRVWDEMKKNAAAASNNPQGGLRLLYKELTRSVYAKIKPRLRFHLIGHSAGAIFHAYLLPVLLGANLRVDGIYLMAPACSIELFASNILPHYQAGKVMAYTQFYLTDLAERQDNCAGVYRRSLLYLVSDAFEHQRKTPLLGMEKYLSNLQQPHTQPSQAGQIWDWIAAPTGQSASSIARSNSTSHGGFSSDSDTREAILERIATRSGAGSTASAAVSEVRRSPRGGRKRRA